MTILHLYNNYREAQFAMHELVSNNPRDVLMDRYNQNKCIYNGDEHWFITEYEYDRWSKGRDYYMYNNEIYHGGYRLKGE